MPGYRKSECKENPDCSTAQRLLDENRDEMRIGEWTVYLSLPFFMPSPILSPNMTLEHDP